MVELVFFRDNIKIKCMFLYLFNVSIGEKLFYLEWDYFVSGVNLDC